LLVTQLANIIVTLPPWCEADLTPGTTNITHN